MNKKIARVFPRITKATPNDDLCFFTEPPILGLPEIDEVHVSVTFTYDRKKAEELAYQWEMVGVSVKIGGPAYDDPAEGQFIPGRYLKNGYTITSRGCNNKCWFCSAWRREGKLRELEIKDGWDVMDNNLLQCSEAHIRAVFEMLKRQPQRPKFTGGLEAKELKPWHCGGKMKIMAPEGIAKYPADIYYRPRCDECFAIGAAGRTAKQAIRFWNTRATILTPEQIKRLEEME